MPNPVQHGRQNLLPRPVSGPDQPALPCPRRLRAAGIFCSALPAPAYHIGNRICHPRRELPPQYRIRLRPGTCPPLPAPAYFCIVLATKRPPLLQAPASSKDGFLFWRWGLRIPRGTAPPPPRAAPACLHVLSLLNGLLPLPWHTSFPPLHTPPGIKARGLLRHALALYAFTTSPANCRPVRLPPDTSSASGGGGFLFDLYRLRPLDGDGIFLCGSGPLARPTVRLPGDKRLFAGGKNRWLAQRFLVTRPKKRDVPCVT